MRTDVSHLGRDLGVGASRQLLVDLLARDCLEKLHEGWVERLVCVGVKRRQVDVADARDKGNDLDTVSSRQVLLGDGTGSNTACGRDKHEQS